MARRRRGSMDREPREASPAPTVRRDPLATTDAERLGQHLQTLALGLSIALMTARFLFPGEDAEDGTGLLWVLAVLSTLVLGTLALWVRGVVAIRFSLADTMLIGLIGMITVSELLAADRRVAITMTWEWVGLVVLYLLLRNLPRDPREADAIAGVLVIVAVAASAAALYQVLVEDPLTRQQYLRNPDASLRLAGINPADAGSRAMFEDRLLRSIEPRAPYALANSLAGVLVGPLVLGLATWILTLRREDLSRRMLSLALAIPPLVLVMIVLLLTKSRSAYAGLLVGLSVVGWKCRGITRPRTLILAGAGLMVLVASLITAGLATRQLDREVLTESTKSLAYRWEYWQGSWGVITESVRAFWFGVGPGNFAGPYLKHKLPASSEEISDPHNFVLEIWAHSGLIATILLLAAIALGLRELFGSPQAPLETPSQPPTSPPAPRPGSGRLGWIGWAAGSGWLIGLFLGPLDAFAIDTQTRWLIVGVAGVVAALLLRPLRQWGSRPGWALGASSLAVLVNLLAAGGLTIPPVAMMLWMPIALGQVLRTDRPCGAIRIVGGRWEAFWLLFVAAAIVGLFVGGVATNDWPADAALRNGREALERPRPDYNRALAEFTRAARLDHYAAEPWAALADLEYRRWIAQGMPADRDVPADQQFGIRDRLATAFQLATTPPRDPDSLAIQRLRIELLRRVLELRGPDFDPSVEIRLRRDLADAAGAAARLYPTSAALRAEYAQAEAALGRYGVAAREAREALRLDETTPHAAKKLPDPVRDRLRDVLPRWEAESQSEQEAVAPS